MKSLYFFSLLVATASCFYIDDSSQSKLRIIGGKYSTIDKVPYLAQLITNGKQSCGASIISKYWLVSAAHCFDSSGNRFILTGTSLNSKGGEKHEIEKVIVHEKYNIETVQNDISLIKLKTPINFDKNQKVISIATKPVKTGDVLTLSGFGVSNMNPLTIPEKVKVATVPVVDHDTCVTRYGNLKITDNMLCAGLVDQDSCHSDSGGPGVVNGELTAIVSFSGASGCNSDYFPSVYTYVYNYRGWISEQMSKN